MSQEKWVKASFKYASTDDRLKWLPILIQQLGRKDEILMQIDYQLGDLATAELEIHSQMSPMELDAHAYDSHAWILAAYEIARIIKEEVRVRSRDKYSDADRARVIEGYNYIRRLRIPLAKIEAATGHEDDFVFPLPIINPEHGYGWQVDDNTIVTRIEIRDKLFANFFY